MDEKSIQNLLSNFMETIGDAESLLGAIQKSYRLVQGARFNLFIKGCAQTLLEDQSYSGDQVSRLKGYFENEFGRNQAYDFVKRAIENNSGIATLALGRLFVRCAGRTPTYATSDELIVMKALADLDDREVRVLLEAQKFFEAREVVFKDSADSLEMTREEFNGGFLKVAQDLAVKDHFEMRDIMETFASRRVFSSTVGYLSSDGAGCFGLIRTSRSEAFLEDLAWSMQILHL